MRALFINGPAVGRTEMFDDDRTMIECNAKTYLESLMDGDGDCPKKVTYHRIAIDTSGNSIFSVCKEL